MRKYRIKRRDGKVVLSTADDLLTPSTILAMYSPENDYVPDDAPEKDPLKIEYWNPQAKSWETILDKLADLDSLSGEIKDILGESRRKYRILFSNDNTWTVDSGASPDEFAQRYRLMRDGPDLARVVEISVHDSGGGGHDGWSTVWNNAEELDELSGEIKGLIGEGFLDNPYDYRAVMSGGSYRSISSKHPPDKFLPLYLGNSRIPALKRVDFLDGAEWKTIWDSAEELDSLSGEIKGLLGRE